MARILIIDDIPGVLITLQAMLEEMNHMIVTASDAVQGLELYKRNLNGFDLLITDILMPDMTGIEFIENIKKINSSLPILGISGGGTKISSYEALEIARKVADDVLRKPFTVSELEYAVNNLLGKYAIC